MEKTNTTLEVVFYDKKYKKLMLEGISESEMGITGVFPYYKILRSMYYEIDVFRGTVLNSTIHSRGKSYGEDGSQISEWFSKSETEFQGYVNYVRDEL